MSSPAVSVLMPVYNGEPWLSRAIESVLAQTFTDFELVVVDDGSTDGSAALVESFAERDRRVRLVRKSHEGGRAARRVSLAEARAELVAFLDADDEWVPRRLERELPFVDERTVVFADSYLADGTTRLKRRYSDICRAPELPYPATGLFRDLLFRGCFIMIGTVLVPRALLLDVEAFRDVAPPLQRSGGSDWEAWLLLALGGARFHYLDEPLALYRRRADQMTASVARMLEGTVAVLDGLLPTVRGSDRRLVRRARRRWRRGWAQSFELECRKQGWRQIVAGDTAAARRSLARSLRVRPYSSRAWLALALSLCPPLARRVVRERI